MKQQESIFNPGLIIHQKFDDYSKLQENAKNWLIVTKNRFSKGSFYGAMSGIQLTNLQLGQVEYGEGMLMEGYTPKGCITIGYLEENFGQVCINNQKMKLNDIIIVDDTKSYDFVSSAYTKMSFISIRREILLEKIPAILHMKDIRLKDIENTLSKALQKEWGIVKNYTKISTDVERLFAMEQRIMNVLSSVIKSEFRESIPLTEGEKTSIEIKSYLLNSLKKNISVGDVSKKFLISEKTFQNSFKSLYGMTPKYFIQMLKLNNAHSDLLDCDSKKANISQIAMKWGFKHFGRFAQYYKEVFGELPSQTIKNYKHE